jgi:hypothetical protein
MFNNILMHTKGLRLFSMIIALYGLLINILGLYRNAYTLYVYKDIFSSFTFLVDIMQILFFVILLVLVYIRHVIRDTKVINIFLIICAICIFVNFWLFLANFYFLKLEGLKVFIFWFINNLSNLFIFGLYFTAPILATKIYENKN